MTLSDPIDILPQTSSTTIRRLKSLGITTFEDLLYYFPSRYENYSLISPIAKVQEGEVVTVQGTIKTVNNIYTKKGVTIQKILLTDNTASIELTWYNQPYILRLLPVGTNLSAAGQVVRFLHTYSLEVREYEVIKPSKQELIHTGRIVPIYPEKYGLSSKTIRDKTKKATSLVKNEENTLEWLPEKIRLYNQLITESSSLQKIHFPTSNNDIFNARLRLSFDELFTIQLSSYLIRKEWEKEKVSKKFSLDDKKKRKLDDFIGSIPFRLTHAQQRVLQEILHDLSLERPMNRFLQGDVGSGKTVVAAIACYLAYINNYQSLIMAPTEILAKQHFDTISQLLQNYGITIGLQTRAKKIGKKQSMNDYSVIIGTHALLNERLKFDRVGLVIIDEQHRFGVAQRALLKQKGMNPHLLTMTATPIPRTVALTLYGELDLSLIDEMPQGRLPIKTYLVPAAKRSSAYQWIQDQIKTNHSQVFIICPFIEESVSETMTTVKAAKKEFDHLQRKVYPDLKLGLLHGRMKSKEKDQMMMDFKNRNYDILVSTSVVEVGIDVPNATIMVIEGGERYGLAQLHQLRGRVGRGEKESYCLLFTSNDEKSERLEFFARTLSGITLAEYDFKLRGPGQIFGTAQHGYLDLKIANISDVALIERVKNAVRYFVQRYSLESFPAIEKRIENFRINQITKD